MPFPLIIPFLIKGAAIATKAIIAQKKVAVVTKTITAASHTYGTAAVVSATTITLTTIGGISWTADRYDDAKKCYYLWEKGDIEGAIKQMSSLCSKLIGIQNNPETIVHSAGKLLEMNGFDNEKVLQFIKDLCDSIDEIQNEISK